jgi:hypothetical protein
MQHKRLILTLVVIICSLANYTQAKANPEYKLPENSYELLLQLNYQGIVKTDLLAVGIDTTYYVPFLLIMEKLRIFNEFDYTNKTMKGYLIEKDSSFYLDFRTGNCEALGKKIKLDKDEFLVDQMEVYVQPEVFEKLFDFQVNLYYLKLLLNVTSKFDLPIKEAYKRFMGHSFLQDDGEARRDYAPLLFDRKQSFLNGGVMTYNLSASYDSRRNQSYSFGNNLGMEVLGGDLNLSGSGSFARRPYTDMLIDTSNVLPDTSYISGAELSQNFNYRYKWRYFVGDNDFLTFFSVGNLSSSGFRSSSLPSTSFTGIQLTNETTKMPLDFSTIVYEDYIEPGWEVELYKDGFLEKRIVTDAEGYYRFDLPVDYGSANIELRFYGPRGEYEVKKELIRIPTEFLQPGEFKYSLNFGQRTDTLSYGEARLSAGLTSWLSNSVSLVKIDSSKTLDELLKSDKLGTVDNMNFHNATSIRFRSDLFMTYSWAYQDYHKFDIRFWPLDFGSYSIVYTVFDNHKVYNGSAISKLDARIQLPRLWDLPFNLNFNYARENNGNTKNNTFSTRFNFNIDKLRINTSYNANVLESPGSEEPLVLNHTSNVGFSYNIMRMPSFLEFISSISFNLNNNIDLTAGQLTSQSLSINQMLFKKLNLNVNLQKSYSSSNDLSMSVGIRYDFGSFKTRTEANTSFQEDWSCSQQVEGVLGFSSDLGELIFSNSTVGVNVGNGAANIRIFVDANGNDLYDEGEVVVPGVRISIPSATTNYRDQGGMIQAYNLRAYERYNLTIDKNSFKNPMWIPKYEEFSFIADPNVFKQIDVPCYVGGVLQGGVFKIDSTGKTGQAGVKVHILSADSTFSLELPVFSDGSFYHIGLAPGDYIAFVDSMQLAVLKSNSEPAVNHFTVKPTETGDFVMDVNFDLIPKGFLKPTQDPTESKLMVNEQQPSLLDEEYKEKEDVTLLNFDDATDAALNSKMRNTLDSIINYLEENPSYSIEIIGHTDAFSLMNT